jgi:hypothetical protein
MLIPFEVGALPFFTAFAENAAARVNDLQNQSSSTHAFSINCLEIFTYSASFIANGN